MTFTDITTPNWKMVRDMQEEIDMLHAENALKLAQILDLEQLVYDLREIDDGFDGKPCWCKNIDKSFFTGEHEAECIKAQQATEPFWRKETE